MLQDANVCLSRRDTLGLLVAMIIFACSGSNSAHQG
jgi:hypothetical protein